MNCTEFPPDKLLPTSDVLPSINVTVPVAVPVPEDCTVAVKTTDCPNVAGFKFDATLVVAVAWFTASVRMPEVLLAKLLSPLYLAVIECEPAVKFETASCATLLEIAVVPKDVVPSKKVTVPVGVPVPVGCTVAVKTTDWPNVAGFTFDATLVVAVA